MTTWVEGFLKWLSAPLDLPGGGSVVGIAAALCGPQPSI
jgi:hypothetical protein